MIEALIGIVVLAAFTYLVFKYGFKIDLIKKIKGLFK